MVIPNLPSKESPLFWCPRCLAFKICPRGSCESEQVGIIRTEYIIDSNIKINNGNKSTT